MTNTLIKGLVLCLVIMSGTSAYAGVSEETQIYRYVPHESVLVGTLRLGIFYGPPGYGEYPDTDTKESALILVLDEPIDVIADAEDEYNETRHGITEVQLVFDPVKWGGFKGLMNQKRRVSGTLFSSHTGHHHTPVLMTVSSIVRSD